MRNPAVMTLWRTSAAIATAARIDSGRRQPLSSAVIEKLTVSPGSFASNLNLQS